MKIEEFFNEYKIKRNPIQLNSPYENRMIEPDEDVQDEIEEELPTNHTWTLTEDNGKFRIVTGIVNRNAMGYFVSSKPWSNRKMIIEIE